MAVRTWTGGSGTWNSTNSASWGGSIPNSGDTVVFSATGTYTVTIDSTAVANGMTITPAATTGAVTFIASTPGTRVKTGPVSITGTSGSVILGSNIIFGNAAGTADVGITHTGSTINLNGRTLTCLSYTNTGSAVRGLNFSTTNSAINITGNSLSVWSVASTTNMTVTGADPNVSFTYTGGTGTRTISGTGSTTASINATFLSSSDTISLTSGIRLNNLTISSGSTAVVANTTVNIAGSVDIPSGVTLTGGTLAWTLLGTGNIKIVPTLDCPITFNGTSYTLQNNLTIGSSRTATLTSGTINLGTFTLSTGLFAGSGTTTRSINFGTGKIVLTNIPATSATVWSFSTATNFTTSGSTKLVELIPAGSTRLLTNGSTNGSDVNAISISLTGQSGGSLDITGAIENLSLANLSGSFPSNVMTIYGDFDVSAAAVASSATAITFLPPISTTKTIKLTSTFQRAITFSGQGTSTIIGNPINTVNRAMTVNSGTIDVGTTTTVVCGTLITNGGTLNLGSSTVDCTTLTGSGGNIEGNNPSINVSATTGAVINSAANISKTVFVTTASGSGIRTITLKDSGLEAYSPRLSVNLSFTGSLTIGSSNGNLRFNGLYLGSDSSVNTINVSSPVIIYEGGLLAGSTQTPTFSGAITFKSTTSASNTTMNVYNSISAPIIIDIPYNSTFYNQRRLITPSLTVYRGTINSTNTFSPTALSLTADNTLSLNLSAGTATIAISSVTISGNGTVNTDYNFFNSLSSFSISGSSAFNNTSTETSGTCGTLSLNTTGIINFGSLTSLNVTGFTLNTLNYSIGSTWPTFNLTNTSINRLLCNSTVPTNINAPATLTELSGTGTFSSLILTGTSRKVLSLLTNTAINTLTINNTSYTSRCIIESDNYSIRRTLTLSNPIASTYLDFIGINMNYIGAGQALSNTTSIGDAGNNLNITGTAAREVYYNAGSAGWVSASWSIMDSGSLSDTSTQYIPLPQDNVILPSVSVSPSFTAGTSISVDREIFCTNIVSTDRSDAATIALASNFLNVLGNLELNSATTISNGTLQFIGTSKKYINNINSTTNINLPNVIFNQDIDCQAPILNCSSAVYNTGSGYFKNITCTGNFTKSNTYLQLSGALDCNTITMNSSGNTNCYSIRSSGALTVTNENITCTTSIVSNTTSFSGSSSCISDSITSNNLLQFATAGTLTFNNIVSPGINIYNGVINVNSSLTCISLTVYGSGQLNFNNAIMYVDLFNAKDNIDPNSYPINFSNSSIVLGSQGSTIPYISAEGVVFNPSTSVNFLYLDNTFTVNTFLISGNLRYSNITKQDLTKSSTVYFNSDVYADNLDIGNGSLLTEAPGSTLRRITPGGESIVKNLAINGVSARGFAEEETSWRAPSNLGSTVTSATGWITSVYIIATYLGNFLSFF